MAVIRPFKALKPTKENAPVVASVPYDVVNREEAKEKAKGNKLSFLRVTRSEIDLDDIINPYSSEVYKKAKETLEQFKKEKILIQDSKPHFYLYRLLMAGRTQVGILGTFSIDEYDDNVILKHEKTRKEKEDDRTNHIITTEAQTGPVFLTYKGVESINKIVDKVLESEPLFLFTSSDGIRHTIWQVLEEHNATIIDEIGKVWNLYIADGHHRAASASRAQKVKKESNPNHIGDEEYNYFIGVLFPAEQLHIMPYNRVVFNLNGNTKQEFLNKISEKFVYDKINVKEPVDRRNIGMYLGGVWYNLKPKDSVIASISLAKSVAETLDVSILQDFLLNPILGIDDPRTNKNIDFIGGIRGTAELEKLVNSGKAMVAFSLYPVSVNDLMSIADAGEVMPPKSTWFEPKLRDGLLVHLI
ncbi:MAG: hypothetical protein A2315_17360 [Ignavibacteria bacterium RIFOXYB2_FULL_35_12]|nr:MAG: hypothetical protein A2006_08675 [Ignavibacteria bacterium GWC2_35_8]OGU61602.1 MAG: hypothetical protein A2X60_06540 [Ignavibacteria bacterium GWF2_35_20]OGU78310.1 MAG: hypothetical protein A2254_16290 [Ignavibacteria bacterium RIFOXYA2_FULL_35_9]OGU88073.1 MAG: hypothetical protein A3K31_16460 [Ignavibacteria bacterium RIFOXYA12_FULL_35_25]OGU93100.1 MAG: hypothetical protein A2347_07845 [Ignavibacteria bacterium RIFOXYB12_FULL_35_14]OGU98259.1 MAG: hypothetical protein A2455_15570 